MCRRATDALVEGENGMLRGDRIIMAAIVVVSLVWSAIAMKAMQMSAPDVLESSLDKRQADVGR